MPKEQPSASARLHGKRPPCSAAWQHTRRSIDTPVGPLPAACRRLPRRETLRCVARTALRTKLYEKLADQLTDIVVDAVLTIKKPDQPLDLYMVRNND